jgi:Fur family transcriptional regulator, ferric uptake regulator
MPKTGLTPKKGAASQPSLGQRHSRQRAIIFEILKASDGPLTIPQIHEKARMGLQKMKDAKSKTIGIATVYRTILLLQESKLIQSVILPTGETRYESSHLDAHHHHFQCRKCEHVFDLGVCPVGIPDGTTIPGGYLVDSHELTLYGLCPACVPGKKAK